MKQLNEQTRKLELKSHPRASGVKLIEAAQPFILRVDYTKEVLDAAMDEYWLLRLPTLPQELVSQGKPVPPIELTKDVVYEAFEGKWSFYAPLLHSLAMGELGSRDPLFTQDFGIMELDGKYAITCEVYFVPRGYFQTENIQKVEIDDEPPVDAQAVAQSTDRYLTGLVGADKHAYDTQYNDVYERYYKQFQAKRAANISERAVTKLLEQMRFDPLPTEWVKAKAQQRYASIQQYNDPKTILGVGTADEAMLRLYDDARTEAWTVIALLTYGREVGVTRTQEEVIGNLASYFQRAVQHLLDNHVVLRAPATAS